MVKTLNHYPYLRVFICLIGLWFIAFNAYAGDGRSPRQHHEPGRFFNRIASFPVYLNASIDQQSVSEIVDVSKDGNILIYTDGAGGKIGFVDIHDPDHPQPLGSLEVEGEPTSVAVAGNYALAVINTSGDFDNPSGLLRVIDIAQQTVIQSFDLGGQPDAIAISPDGKYAAIVIENERDEAFNGGKLPQRPSGFLVIVDIDDEPAKWRMRQVGLTGIAYPYPSDAEPEYVDINDDNVAVVTFQENNYLALVDVASGRIIDHFSAGTVDLSAIDTREESTAFIRLTDRQSQRAREPDGVAWLNTELFVTANEGDLDGGSRDFTVFDHHGRVVFTAGNALDHQAVRLGHYPDKRSGNKGNEPENVDVGRYGKDTFLFIASERANLIFVYRVNNGGRSFRLMQTLPAGVAPEGIKAIPGRNLLVAAGEVDDRKKGIRSVLTLYRLQDKPAGYPTVESANRNDGTPIPWGALSGLSMDLYDEHIAYAIHDGFFRQSRIYKLNTSRHPAVIQAEIVLTDSRGRLAEVAPDLVNADGTVNLDGEGISSSANGGFWIASEGAGSPGDEKKSITRKNLLVHVDRFGDIDRVVLLPGATDVKQKHFGLQGVASVGKSDNEVLFVAFQREWLGDRSGHVRVGRYDVANAEWSFYYYPLDKADSANGGWVGLSEIIALGDQEFAVIERDNQANNDARIKRIYRFTIAGLSALTEEHAPFFPVVQKTLLADLLPTLKASGGMVLEKIEGMTVNEHGDILVVNDNDGVDGSNGETQLLTLQHLLH
ncbi:esterase-like activity of phytase family protein [Methylomarinum vadi]|uniref:esterase-like activity of phytase family protein n=1 Tax=Methylomarinum vadi TaxID=438855 RepID=UPI00068AA234|nr:esterase-like activity of phytase family protein [Methylomarinum vadi]